MATKQHIKDTINVLCKLILHNGGTKITPETFRLAKFDKNEVTGVMWELLYETMWYLNYQSFRTTEDFNGEKNRDLILWIKHELFTRGYYAKDFYQLPGDTSFGSREILLAFGWLVSKSKLLNLFLDSCNCIFEECLPIDWESLIDPNTSNSEKYTRISRNLSHEPVETMNLDQLSWIVGNMTLTFKGLFTAENQLVSLVSKVHSSTQGVAMPKGHLSALEVYLLRHPKELVRFIEKTQQYNIYLENLLKFVELQDIFWKWLESVYEAKELECEDSERLMWSGKEPCRTCCEITHEKLSDISIIQHEIQKFINDNDKKCPKASMQVHSDKMQTICQTKLQELNEKLESSNLKEKPQANSERQTFLELKHVVNNGDVKHCEQSCAKLQIDVLKRELSDLELKLLELRNEHFDILNDLVGNLKDSVFIPPIGNSKYNELRNK